MAKTKKTSPGVVIKEIAAGKKMWSQTYQCCVEVLEVLPDAIRIRVPSSNGPFVTEVQGSDLLDDMNCH